MRLTVVRAGLFSALLFLVLPMSRTNNFFVVRLAGRNADGEKHKTCARQCMVFLILLSFRVRWERRSNGVVVLAVAR
ncbi:hypothetical protein BD289DRAFT_423939 [Coniella lustricola]|uniref:Secreted protein n=1 Tax=Coniella lustricola TaxID=2025994 RepID=A0A2T3AJ31_9PEZI|nr:hypothetical protein BD289DRAFT_423939 [Coniella lustricola]